MKNNYDSKEQLSSIEQVFDGDFPDNFVNNVAYWGNFPKEELHELDANGEPKLLHMDIDLGNYCSLACAHCFRRDDRVDSDDDNPFLDEDQMLEYVSEAKDLGLRSVKFLGRGEPFQNRKFLGFLEKLTEMGVGASIFTKGHVVGDDRLTKAYNGHYGISTGQELADRLKELDVSILLGFNSFDAQAQNMYVGGENAGIKNYTQLRDAALLKFVNAGFNEYVKGEPTRLGLIAAPLKPENLSEISDMYKWGRRINAYQLCCPTNLSGKGLDEFKRTEKFKDYNKHLEKMYSDIYVWNIENNLMSLDQFKEEGVSLYPGCHPCNQTAAGMYLTLSGKVIRCPGRADKQSTFTDDIRDEESLQAVWRKSENYRRAKGSIKSPEGNDFNYHCVARDGRNMPVDFYSKVTDNVIEHFEK